MEKAVFSILERHPELQIICSLDMGMNSRVLTIEFKLRNGSKSKEVYLFQDTIEDGNVPGILHELENKFFQEQKKELTNLRKIRRGGQK